MRGNAVYTIIEIIIEFFAETLFGDSPSRVREAIRDKKIQRRIKKLTRQYEWFQLMYEKEGYKYTIDRHPDIHIRIMDKLYIRRIELDIGEREIFDTYIRSKMK